LGIWQALLRIYKAVVLRIRQGCCCLFVGLLFSDSSRLFCGFIGLYCEHVLFISCKRDMAVLRLCRALLCMYRAVLRTYCMHKSKEIRRHVHPWGTHCTTLQHSETHCTSLHHAATRCNTLQHTATHDITLHHAVPNCNTLHTLFLGCKRD